jgi:translation initiation factor eIF-2B subunit delta
LIAKHFTSQSKGGGSGSGGGGGGGASGGGGTTAEVHPSLVALGLQTVSGGPAIVGSNARCVAMLGGFKKLVDEYATPPGKHISRDLASALRPSIGFLIRCRPLAISMGNAIKWLKGKIASLPLTMSEQEAKATLTDAIDSYIQEKVVFAHTVIADVANRKIYPGETVLTYGYSDVIEEMLKRAHSVGKRVRVIIVDAKPRLEGKTLLTSLVAHGIECSYVLLNAVSYIMKDVSKVFIGAVAMLNNGTAMGRAGTAMVAMTAHAYNTPVMICCETYKFCERAQLDSICFNELGEPLFSDETMHASQRWHHEHGRQSQRRWALHLLRYARCVVLGRFSG